MSGRARLVVLISGRGSNMLALHRATLRRGFPGEIVGVLADTEAAPGLEAARARRIDTAAVSRSGGEPNSAHEARVLAAIRPWRPDLVCLAGYMRILSPAFIAALGGRVLNIHPSLLPRHPGLHTHERAIAAGDATHGCTVHWVTAGVDEGPVVAQSALGVRAGETPAALGRRVLALEHALYPMAVAHVLERRI